MKLNKELISMEHEMNLKSLELGNLYKTERIPFSFEMTDVYYQCLYEYQSLRKEYNELYNELHKNKGLSQAEQKEKERLAKVKIRENSITSTTYERAIKSICKQIDNRFK